MSTEWSLLFYETDAGKQPVQEFIDKLPWKEREKLRLTIERLCEKGITLRMPHARFIEGEKNLFELRSQCGNNIQRVFYCHFSEKTFILLHGFTKKTQRTPKSEIDTALRCRDDYFRRHKSS